MVKGKGFWFGIGVGILSAIVVYVIGLRGAMQSSRVFFFSGVRSVLTPATDRSSMATSSSGPKWAQKTITLPPQRRGCHLITPKILKEIGQDLSGFNCGLAHVFLQHTSASLTINENYDPDVQADTETFLNKIVPEGGSAPWRHTMEGPDDMPAHIKSSMFGCQLTIPITKGKLNMGTWQGIWLCEHRDDPTARRVVVTLNGISSCFVTSCGIFGLVMECYLLFCETMLLRNVHIVVLIASEKYISYTKPIRKVKKLK